MRWSQPRALPRTYCGVRMVATFGPQASLEYAKRHDLGDVPVDMTGFNAFYEARRDCLLGRLRRLLGADRYEVGA